MRMFWNSVRVGPLLVIIGCGGSPAAPDFVAEPEPDGADCTIDTAGGRLLPLAEGVQWVHVRTDLETLAKDEKSLVVGPFMDIGGEKSGRMGHRLTTVKDNGETVRYFEDTGNAVVEHRKQDLAGATHHDEYFVDSKIRVDESTERLQLDASYTETYVEQSTNLTTNLATTKDRTAEWRLRRLGEEVTVPAGTFCTVRLSRQVTTDGEVGDEKLYWYAPGVGKVKERDGNKLEELASYTP